MTTPLKIYLAGPEVFLENATEVLERKRQVCEQMGWIGLSPVDNEVPHTASTPEDIAMAIYSGNVAMMDAADAIIANITPFRGPHMDPGTAFEVGYFAAQGKPIMVYTQVEPDLVERVVAWSHPDVKRNGHEIRDRNNHLIEDFGMSENLMIEAAIDNQGIDVDVVVSPVPFDQVFNCEKGFVAAAQRLQTMLGLAEAFQASPRRPKP